MSVITTGSNPKALWPGIKAWWGRFYDEHPVEYTALFETLTSDKAYEEDVLAPGFGLGVVKPQGQATVYDTEIQGFTTRYTHVGYALGFIVTREEIDDNLYPKISRTRTQALAFSMRQTKENVAANVYNRGFSTSFPIGDGAALLSAAHPTEAGNQSNILAVAADLSELALEDLTIQIMETVDHKGKKISIMPQTLIVPPSLFYEAHRILDSNLQNDTDNNALNVLNSQRIFPGGVIVNHYLTDRDAYFIRTNAPEGMKHYARMPIEFTQDNEFDTENLKAKAYERYSFGATDWRGLFGSPGA